MQAESGKVSDFLKGPKQFRIPSYQRPYSWGKSDWLTIWIDVLDQYDRIAKIYEGSTDENARNAELKRMPSHYIGAIVQANPSAIGLTKTTVVDGQQRLTTITVMLAALRDVWRRRMIDNGSEQALIDGLVTRIESAYLTNPGYVGNESYRLWLQPRDRRAFEIVLDQDKSRPIKKIQGDLLNLSPGESPSIIAAYNFFFTEMQRSSAPSLLQLEQFARNYPLDPVLLEAAIADRLYAITMQTGTEEDVNAIFESLNTKGRPLRQVDLLKNFLFLRLGEEAESIIQSEWIPIEAQLPDSAKLEHFVWANTVADGNDILQKRTYSTIHQMHAGGDNASIVVYVKSLRQFSHLFRKLIQPEDEENERLRLAFTSLLRAGGITAIPLAFYAYRRKATENLEPEELVESCRLIESFLVRRMLCGMPTNNLNPMFGSMLSKLHRGEFPLTGRLSEDVGRALTIRPKEWPTDEEVHKQAIMSDFYHSQKTAQRLLILEKLDRAMTTDGVIPNYFDSDKTIEHIAPQNPSAVAWKADLGDEGWKLLQQDRLHSIGNLTLLPPAINSELGDSSWFNKRSKYVESGYAMTVAATGYAYGDENWNIGEIDSRTAALVDLAISLWPRSPNVELSVPVVAAEVEEEDVDLFDSFVTDSELEEIQESES